MSQPLRDPASIQRITALTASQRVRERLQAAGTRFHANDNIADYLEEGDLEAIEGEVAARAQEMLRALVIDVGNDHNTRETGAAWPRCSCGSCLPDATKRRPRSPSSRMRSAWRS